MYALEGKEALDVAASFAARDERQSLEHDDLDDAWLS